MAGVSFPVQYTKKIAHETLFSQVCKTSLQCSVFSRHRIKITNQDTILKMEIPGAATSAVL